MSGEECKPEVDFVPPQSKKRKVVEKNGYADEYDGLGPMPVGERTLQLRNEHIA